VQTTGAVIDRPTKVGDGDRALPARRPGRLSRPALGLLTPNWFAVVMGTGIVSVAASSLPFHPPGLRTLAVAAWIAAGLVLVVLILNWALHWRELPGDIRAHSLDPSVAPFFGAPAMALLTVGAATLLTGVPLLGLHWALVVDGVLWTAGTTLGLVVCVVIPYLMFTRHALKLSDALGSWMMPIVPPMVSAATGALLVPYVAAGQGRLDLLLGCYGCFGISAVAATVTLSLLWNRLVFHHVGPAVTVPTLWIVLGPLGQSITAINLLGRVAGTALPATQAADLKLIGLLYGTAVWGFALVWLAIAVAITIRTARQHLPFSMSWWSFTFPVGTMVTGTSALFVATSSQALRWAAAGLFLLLLVAWVTTAGRTAAATWRGHLTPPVAKRHRSDVERPVT
jgi:C4-dicarboxylate transporter/malic acid transport protein